MTFIIYIVELNKQNFGGGVKVNLFSAYLLPILIIGCLFYLVRTFNLLMFSSIDAADLTHLIYLPAGIRLLSVAIYGRLGILGITFGWYLCHVISDEKMLLESLFLGFISGFTAYLSLQIWQKYFHITDNFSGLTSRLAIYLVLISAVISALVRYLYLYSFDPLIPFISIFLVGLTGDILGAFIVLYLVKIIVRLTKNIAAR